MKKSKCDLRKEYQKALMKLLTEYKPTESHLEQLRQKFTVGEANVRV